ncbi:MAG TPA: choline kinase family protein [Solirubrobacteraceae bacterium]|nr:choline kinase family protein [Solirubrobacteraceae bacterium]
MGDLNDILHDLEHSLGFLGGEPVPLEGGITNRNFKVSFGGSDYVVRLHGKDTDLLGISREAERVANTAAAGLGIAPAVVASFEGGLVTRYISCASMEAPEIAARAEEIGRALRRFHDSAVELPVSFSVPDLLEEYGRLIAERGGRPSADYEHARELATQIVAAAPARTQRPCHNDLLAGNLVRERPSDRVMIVDWEYAGMGDPGFDLGNLSVNNDFDEAAEERLLAAYHDCTPSPPQRARLKLMRLLSDIREAAWGAMQARVSDLDFDFEGYGERHFARLREALAGPELAGWLAAVS